MEINFNSPYLNKLIDFALAEDIGAGDVTTNSIIPESSTNKAVLLVKQKGVIAGIPIAKIVFNKLDVGLKLTQPLKDGSTVNPGDIVAEISGTTRAILTGERTALNFVQRISGIATLTRGFVDAVHGLPVQILDTRKTAPGLRMLDKYAVMMGGGINHRMGLYGAILIKDNHVKFAGGIKNAVSLARDNNKGKFIIEVETTTLEEVKEALDVGAERILLDNMSAEMIRDAVAIIDGKAETEVSGGVNLENVRRYAETGVDFISVGYITHSATALDVSLDML